MEILVGVDDSDELAFRAEVDRVRGSGALGETGRLLELFDFLASRGGHSPAVSQGEIAEAVFGQAETSIDDATVRVYIHRLRKRLEDHYADRSNEPGAARLTVPSGTYALRLQQGPAEDNDPQISAEPGRWQRFRLPAIGVVAALALVGAFLLGRTTPAASGPAPNAIWQPFLESPRPKLIVVGDYYMFGEIDPVRPDEGRLIRDFRVNSPSDLITMQELEPERYGAADDVGLNYLPFSVAYGLQSIVPVLTRSGRNVTVLAASDLQPDMLNYFDVIYVGLFSGMALLEDVNFMESEFDMGDTYDELIDTASDTTYTSEEARRVSTPAYYRDYGYFARFRTPSGALVAIVAGARDTGVRGLVPLVTGPTLPSDVEKLAESGDFEAVFQITGQQGADLSERLLMSRARR